VIGANGAGKTTLLRAISGVQPVSAGSISFDDKPLLKFSAHHRAGLASRIVPEGRHVFAPLSVEDNLLVGAWSVKRSATPDGSQIEWTYDAFPILKEKTKGSCREPFRRPATDAGHWASHDVSPKAPVCSTKPSMGLAPIMVSQIFDTLDRLKAEGMTIVIVEQNANAALEFSDRAYVVETGAIIWKAHRAPFRRIRASAKPILERDLLRCLATRDGEYDEICCGVKFVV